MSKVTPGQLRVYLEQAGYPLRASETRLKELLTDEWEAMNAGEHRRCKDLLSIAIGSYELLEHSLGELMVRLQLHRQLDGGGSSDGPQRDVRPEDSGAG